MPWIIRCKIFSGLSWKKIATLIGEKCTGEGGKEYQRFMKENKGLS